MLAYTCYIPLSRIPPTSPASVNHISFSPPPFFLTVQLSWILFWKVLALFICPEVSSHPLLWTHFPSWLDMGPFCYFSPIVTWCGGRSCPSPLAICGLYQGIKITICDPKAMHLILHLLSAVIKVDTSFLSKRKWFKMLLLVFTFKL